MKTDRSPWRSPVGLMILEDLVHRSSREVLHPVRRRIVEVFGLRQSQGPRAFVMDNLINEFP